LVSRKPSRGEHCIVVDQSPSPSIDAILLFWFGIPQTPDAQYSQRRKLWFGKNPEFDRNIHDRFHSLYEQAAKGELDSWQASPKGSLALILLLDQFPRNMFRDTPRAFATDAKACAIAKQSIAQQIDRVLEPIQRIFIYLPLEHRENLADQHQCVQLFEELVAGSPELADCLDYARRHQAVIDRFGRFPHRNRILGRPSTPAEVEFLQQPGSSF
jgi:uncharacterized protein (DUF924 family)